MKNIKLFAVIGAIVLVSVGVGMVRYHADAYYLTCELLNNCPGNIGTTADGGSVCHDLQVWASGGSSDVFNFSSMDDNDLASLIEDCGINGVYITYSGGGGNSGGDSPNGGGQPVGPTGCTDDLTNTTLYPNYLRSTCGEQKTNQTIATLKCAIPSGATSCTASGTLPPISPDPGFNTKTVYSADWLGGPYPPVPLSNSYGTIIVWQDILNGGIVFPKGTPQTAKMAYSISIGSQPALTGFIYANTGFYQRYPTGNPGDPISLTITGAPGDSVAIGFVAGIITQCYSSSSSNQQWGLPAWIDANDTSLGRRNYVWDSWFTCRPDNLPASTTPSVTPAPAIGLSTLSDAVKYPNSSSVTNVINEGGGSLDWDTKGIIADASGKNKGPHLATLPKWMHVADAAQGTWSAFAPMSGAGVTSTPQAVNFTYDPTQVDAIGTSTAEITFYCDPAASVPCQQNASSVAYDVSYNVPGPQVTLTSTLTSVIAGNPVTLTWFSSATNATRPISSSNFRTNSANGSITVYPTSTTTYRITVKGLSDTDTDSDNFATATVTVAATQPSPTAPTCTANPTSTTLGRNVTFTVGGSGSNYVWSKNGTTFTTTPAATYVTQFTIADGTNPFVYVKNVGDANSNAGSCSVQINENSGLGPVDVAPIALLTVNGQNTITVSVGDTVHYAWNSSEATSWTSCYSQNVADAYNSGPGPYCGGLDVTGPSGSSTHTIASGQAGVTYKFTYYATNSVGTSSSTVTINVLPTGNEPPSTSTSTPTSTSSLSSLSVSLTSAEDPTSGAVPVTVTLNAVVTGGTTTNTAPPANQNSTPPTAGQTRPPAGSARLPVVAATQFPATVFVEDPTVYVHSSPDTSSPLAGSQSLHPADTFTATKEVTGTDGNPWWVSSGGNYVPAAGTQVESSLLLAPAVKTASDGSGGSYAVTYSFIPDGSERATFTCGGTTYFIEGNGTYSVGSDYSVSPLPLFGGNNCQNLLASTNNTALVRNIKSGMMASPVLAPGFNPLSAVEPFAASLAPIVFDANGNPLAVKSTSQSGGYSWYSLGNGYYLQPNLIGGPGLAGNASLAQTFYVVPQNLQPSVNSNGFPTSVSGNFGVLNGQDMGQNGYKNLVTAPVTLAVQAASTAPSSVTGSNLKIVPIPGPSTASISAFVLYKGVLLSVVGKSGQTAYQYVIDNHLTNVKVAGTTGGGYQVVNANGDILITLNGNGTGTSLSAFYAALKDDPANAISTAKADGFNVTTGGTDSDGNGTYLISNSNGEFIAALGEFLVSTVTGPGVPNGGTLSSSYNYPIASCDVAGSTAKVNVWPDGKSYNMAADQNYSLIVACDSTDPVPCSATTAAATAAADKIAAGGGPSYTLNGSGANQLLVQWAPKLNKNLPSTAIGVSYPFVYGSQDGTSGCQVQLKTPSGLSGFANTHLGYGTDYQLNVAMPHEMEHCMGLGHSSDPNDLMYYKEPKGAGVSSDDVALLTNLNKEKTIAVSDCGPYNGKLTGPSPTPTPPTGGAKYAELDVALSANGDTAAAAVENGAGYTVTANPDPYDASYYDYNDNEVLYLSPNADFDVNPEPADGYSVTTSGSCSGTATAGMTYACTVTYTATQQTQMYACNENNQCVESSTGTYSDSWCSNECGTSASNVCYTQTDGTVACQCDSGYVQVGDSCKWGGYACNGSGNCAFNPLGGPYTDGTCDYFCKNQ